MKIAMDIDGVTADLVAGFERQYREAFAKPDFSHNGTWDLHAGTVFADAGKLFAYFDRVPNFWRDMPLVPGAAGGCYQLVEQGHAVTFVTNRATEEQRLQTRDWLEAWWPERKNTPTIEFVPSYKGVLDFRFTWTTTRLASKNWLMVGSPAKTSTAASRSWLCLTNRGTVTCRTPQTCGEPKGGTNLLNCCSKLELLDLSL